MLPIEHADKQRSEADFVLKLIRMDEILNPYGRVFPTSSYYLDVMAYPDIDLYITKVSLEQLFDIGSQIATSDLVTQVIFERSDDPVHMPEGQYLKSRIKYGDWGRPWKIDLWSLAENVILHKMVDMRHFQQKMTPHLREQIILTSFQCSLLKSAHRCIAVTISIRLS
jgi:hypothetical protein